MSDFVAVILAAGKGTRMKSNLPKVLHPMAGKSLIDHVLDKTLELGIEKVYTILGHEREIIEQHIKDRSSIIIQKEQLGTGHALMQAVPFLENIKHLLVLSGDQPLLTTETINKLISAHKKTGATATVLTAELDNPYGYGRIIKKENSFAGIVEEKDASLEQRKIKEINTGTYCFNVDKLKQALKKISTKNVQKEYYLTDVFDVFLSRGELIETLCTDEQAEALGINNRVQLAEAEEIYFSRIRKYWMLRGVTMVNPQSVFIDADVRIEKDATIYPFTILKGKTIIEGGAVIGPRTTLESCICGENCVIESSVGRKAVIGKNCLVGPFAYLRPGTELKDGVKIGDFVEVKNSQIGFGSKIPHLSYVGDSSVGNNVNIGAGTITCNYDGKNKYRTEIGDNAFVGSNTNFVAPVSIGKNTVIGAGSTITKDVPENALAVERAQQRNVVKRFAVKEEL